MQTFRTCGRRSLCHRAATAILVAFVLPDTCHALIFAPPPAEAQGFVDAQPQRPPKDPYRLPSVRFGLAHHDLVPLVATPPFDRARVAAEDDASRAAGDRRLRFGIRRDLWLAPSMGRWDDVPGGRVWRADLTSEGADGLRLHFMSAELPPGAELAVSCLATPGVVFGPFTSSGEFWAPSCFGGDTVRVEYFQPATLRRTIVKHPFVIDAVQHLYRDPTVVAAESGFDPRVGNCHINVACHASWSNVALAVGGVSTIGTSGALFCTGQLLATLNADQTPYFLTANHCVANASEAAATEIVWRYQTSSCSTSPPALAALPRSGPCTMLATGTAATSADYALLMVEGEIPPGLAWVGWVSSAAPSGTPSACVQHPDGSWKRIAFGNKVAGQVCGSSNFAQIDWSSGVTETGSSGAGLFWNDPASTRHQKLYGQLYCGFSACSGVSANNLNDDFGRFDVTYSAISSRLTAGTDDSYEPNNSCASARSISSGTFNNLTVKGMSDDWYTFPLAPGQTLTSSLAFTHLHGDIDFELYTSCGDAPVATSLGASNSESLVYFNASPSLQLVLLHVYLYSDVRNSYSLTIASATLPAPAAACCVGSSCLTATPAACAIAGGVFQGTASLCGPADNPTRCCPANFNETTGLTVQDVFDFLSAYFANLPSADFNLSGGVTVQDIFDFLAAYFAGCS